MTMNPSECTTHGVWIPPGEQCPGCRRSRLAQYRAQLFATASERANHNIAREHCNFHCRAADLEMDIGVIDDEIIALGRELDTVRMVQARAAPCPLDDAHAMETEALRREREYRRLCTGWWDE